MRWSRFILLALVCLSLFHWPSTAQAASGVNVQQFLDRQPGALKSFRDGKYTAAQAIEAYGSYYSLDPRITLTLLELGPKLLSSPQPDAALLRQPFGAAGPQGFAAQIDWQVREVRAGFGPYDSAPVLRFTDGTTTTLDLAQDASVLGVARFLAIGRTQPEWQQLINGYAPLYTQLWGKQPVSVPTPTPIATRPFLRVPWPVGIEMVHSSYFDHVYPTVDRGEVDGNTFIVDYRGRGARSYNTHDGHDFYFPAQPIGTPILAAAGGTAFAYTTRGNGVVIRHGGQFAGYETVYWHLDQFATIFAGKVDTGVGVRVDAGTFLGTSGKSGFTDGGAHLHFEVRHNGKQVDPYGWYGPGSDPCAAWTAGCEASVWLWDDSTRGLYDFTPPDAPAPRDTEAPIGSLAVSPDADLGLLAHFDGSIVPEIGKGFPQLTTGAGQRPSFSEGVWGGGLDVQGAVGLTYPISDNLSLEQGTLAVWARIPESYPQNTTGRHYLWATSANPEDGSIYTDTLALRHENGPDGAVWNFWTVGSDGQAHSLTAPDMLEPGSWHHFAVSWNRSERRVALIIDGQAVASAHDVSLPERAGDRLELGRFVATYGVSAVRLDELAIWKRELGSMELQRLAQRRDPVTNAEGPIATAQVVTDRSVVLDANAIDPQGGIVAVQLKRDDQPWSEPFAYHDDFRWTINGDPGEHTFAIRFRDRADNQMVVTTTLTLQTPLAGDASVRWQDGAAVMLGLDVALAAPDGADRATWLTQNLDMQLSSEVDFVGAVWEPFAARRVWRWDDAARSTVWVRFRDRTGRISAPLSLSLLQLDRTAN